MRPDTPLKVKRTDGAGGMPATGSAISRTSQCCPDSRAGAPRKGALQVRQAHQPACAGTGAVVERSMKVSVKVDVKVDVARCLAALALIVLLIVT